MKLVKPIAFYLPQYHAIPENDESYGKGFTEWTNVKKAMPLFEGHYQPRVPLDGNYYNLLDSEVMIKQVELAKEYGIYGFCYYHYWFANGKKLLEKPLEMMLENKKIDMPFCLCWANENWTRKWDGGNNEIVVQQNYGDMDNLNNHIRYLARFIKDDRYIKIDGRPILLIYRPEIIPNIRQRIRQIKALFRKEGLDVALGMQYPVGEFYGGFRSIFDFYVEFAPQFSSEYDLYERRNVLQRVERNIIYSSAFARFQKYRKRADEKDSPDIYSYDEAWKTIINHKVLSKKAIASAFVDWDNTPRKKNGKLYEGANPQKFGLYFEKLINKIDKDYSYNYVFINAWNEWGEGCYLEPDERYKYGYLEAIKEVLGKDK